MRKFALILVAAASLASVAIIPTAASAGCYRMGETGYHWYRYCFGPAFMYPHHRSCHNGYCYHY